MKTEIKMPMMNHGKSLPVIAALLVAGALYAHEPAKAPSPAAAKASPPVAAVRREGEPDYLHIKEDNEAMERAVETARKTTDKVIAALRSPKANQSRFAVKKPFVEGDQVEHIWLTDVSFDGRLFHGKVDNAPVAIKGVGLGQEVSVAPNEISDWMYIENARLVGGYTIVAMCHHMSPAEKQQFEKNAGCKIE
ncbi:MAG: DUF2314 domain-containing protein [Opitutaceae bacterium]|nr:DUF2314 domain-containing protein [Opitutaceae bacterium]